MNEIIGSLKQSGVLVADGALGTMLIARGLGSGQCPETINLDRPELLLEIASEYLDAGAEIVQTNTFGASPIKLKLYNLDDKTEEINKNAVNMLRKVTRGRAFISASCGPCGRMLTPYGDISPEEVLAGYKRQAKALISAGVELICIETMTDLCEARLAIEAFKAVAPDLPVSASMTFDRTPRGFFTIMGVSVEQAAKGLADAGADIIGSNCGNGIDNMIEIAREFRRHSELPMIIKPNAGLPRLDGDLPVYSETPSFMAEKCIALLELGANIIGGCCGTTPAHIAAIKKTVDSYRRSRDKAKPGR